jgi:hypothetical protein
LITSHWYSESKLYFESIFLEKQIRMAYTQDLNSHNLCTESRFENIGINHMTWLRTLFIASIGLILFSGCGQAAHLTETAMIQMIERSVAQTVAALPSQTPQPTATQLPTDTPTPTESPTATSTPTSILVASPTSTQFLGGSISETQPNLCDNAKFVSDVSVPDGTRFAPGTRFIKTWRLRNTGTCTWTSDYSIFFLNGSKMSGTSPQDLDFVNIKPGETIDISIELVAPSQYGNHTGYWQLQNESKAAFGEGFYVQIQVSATAHTVTPTATQMKTATSSPTASVVIPTETETLEPSPTTTTETP